MTERPKGYFKVPEDTVYLLLGILRLEKDGIKNPASNIDTAQKELKDCLFNPGTIRHTLLA